MNENPTGTPNPLNPGAVAPTPEGPVQPGVAPMPESVTPQAGSMTTPMPEPMPTPQTESMAPEQLVTTTTMESMQYSERPATKRTIEVTENSAPVVAEAEEMVAAETALGADLATAGNQAPEFEPKGFVVESKQKKSSKTPIIILAIICLLAAIGCAVAAIMVLKPFSSDAVPAAMAKLMNGAPSVVTLNGTITTSTSSPLSPAASMQIDFDAGINSATSENYVNATISATPTGSKDNFEFSANEIHTSDGNLYLKLDGVADALQRYLKANAEVLPEDSTTCITNPTTGETVCLTEDNVVNETYIDVDVDDDIDDDTMNCIDDATGQTNCVTSPLSDLEALESLGLFDVIDDEWILIPDSTFSNTTDLVEGDGALQCLVDAAGNLGEYGQNFVSMYKANPFITYSTENIKVAKKKDTIYQLSFDTKELAEFINAMSNSGFINELNACTGALAVSTDTTVTPEALQYVVSMLPEIYVEIDNNNNFTRLYMTNATMDNTYLAAYTATFTVDISFSYPSSITIEKPTDYIEMNDVLSQVLNDFYETDVTE